MASTSGSQLLPRDAVNGLRRLVLPLTTILTPNVPEAELLLKDAQIVTPKLDSISDFVTLAKLVQKLGPAYILLKGGHVPLTAHDLVANQETDRRDVVNILCSHNETIVFHMEYLPSKNTHGTGCSLACKNSYTSRVYLLASLHRCAEKKYPYLSHCLLLQSLHAWLQTLAQICRAHADDLTAAIAANLAVQQPMVEAVERACRYVEAGIRTASDLGKGSGPINHFHSIEVMEYPKSSLKRDVWNGKEDPA